MSDSSSGKLSPTAIANTRVGDVMGRFAVGFYTNPRLIALSLLLVAASGFSSLMVLPRMEDPLLTQRAANVTTQYPGADAERVESLVTEPLEDNLIDVPEIKRMRSQSRAGVSFISIELRDNLVDVEPIWSKVRGKIEDSLSRLPPGATRPVFDQPEIAAYAWIGAITWKRDEEESYGVMRRLARQLKDEFLALPGTKSVDLFGDPGEEVLIEVDAARISSAGISVGEIASQLLRGDVKSSAGSIRNDSTETVVQLTNEFTSIEDILNATLLTQQPGQTLRLTDVARVRRATPEPPPTRALADGESAVVVGVMLRPEFRIDRWTRTANEMLQQFQLQLPNGVTLDLIMQQDRYVTERLRSLCLNLFLGICAVVLTTFLFMGWRSSLLVTTTLPVASLMVIAGMRFLSIPIHQMSVTGLVIALGLMIDNAIIATDEIARNRRRGMSAQNAIHDMVSRLFAPLLQRQP